MLRSFIVELELQRLLRSAHTGQVLFRTRTRDIGLDRFQNTFWTHRPKNLLIDKANAAAVTCIDKNVQRVALGNRHASRTGFDFQKRTSCFGYSIYIADIGGCRNTGVAGYPRVRHYKFKLDKFRWSGPT